MTPDPRADAGQAANDPDGRQFVVVSGRPGGGIDLEAGGSLAEVTVAYETWGTLDGAGDNGVLVLHALTADSHAAGPVGPAHPSPGWWEGLIGPGAPLDTDRYFVVCPNVLGGCRGTTGPASVAPDGAPYGSRW